MTNEVTTQLEQHQWDELANQFTDGCLNASGVWCGGVYRSWYALQR